MKKFENKISRNHAEADTSEGLAHVDFLIESTAQSFEERTVSEETKKAERERLHSASPPHWYSETKLELTPCRLCNKWDGKSRNILQVGSLSFNHGEASKTSPIYTTTKFDSHGDRERKNDSELDKASTRKCPDQSYSDSDPVQNLIRMKISSTEKVRATEFPHECSIHLKINPIHPVTIPCQLQWSPGIPQGIHPKNESKRKVRKERSGHFTKTTESFEAYLSDFDADFKLKWKRIGRRRLKIKKINSVESNALLRPAYLWFFL